MPGITPEEMDELIKKYNQTPESPDMPDESATPVQSLPPDTKFGSGMPVESATPVPTLPADTKFGQGAAYYENGSRDFNDPGRYYGNDPRFSKNDGKAIVAPSLVDPNLSVADRDPRDYSSPSDPTGANADRRAMTRDYLSQKYGQAANSDKYDAAVADQDRTNSIANVGHGLDQIFTSRGAAYGGKGADAGFWNGMKRDAAGKTQEAGDARKQKIADYLMKQKMGSEGVAEIDSIRKSDQQAAMYDPNSGVSRATRAGFKRMLGAEVQNFPELEQMNAADIQGLMKNYEVQAKMSIDRSMKDAQIEALKANEENRGRELELRGDQMRSQQGKTAAEIDYIKARTAQAGKPAQPGQPAAAGVKPSPAIQALDRKYVNDYLKWTTEDKGALDRNLELLRQSEAELQKELDTVGEDQSLISGNAVGRLHKSLRTEKSKKIQTDVEQAALASIKATLSGPTSDRDVEIILSKSYDPTLSISSNLDKIRKSIGIIESTKKEKDRKAAHFEKNGSLGGYQSSPTPESKPTSEVSAKPEETRTFAPLAPPQEGYTWMEDPNDGTRAQVPNKTVDSYKAKGGRVLR